MRARKAVTNQLAKRYQGANRKAKSHLLDEIVALTGWHCDYARATLRQALLPEKPHPVRVGRKPTYPGDQQPVLVL